eukprot:scaffold123529_cov38-Prasinocladus_malaysianus.AAC.1
MGVTNDTTGTIGTRSTPLMMTNSINSPHLRPGHATGRLRLPALHFREVNVQAAQPVTSQKLVQPAPKKLDDF